MLLARVLRIELSRLAHDRRQFEGVFGQFQLARFDARQIQDVAEQRLQRLSRRLHQIQHLTLFSRQIGLGQGLGQADHTIQRRADLMAHVGQKLALGDIGGLGRVTRFGQGLGVALQIGDVVADRDGSALGCAAILNTQPTPAGDLLLAVRGQLTTRLHALVQPFLFATRRLLIATFVDADAQGLSEGQADDQMRLELGVHLGVARIPKH